jgi:dethiobiotin synthetase
MSRGFFVIGTDTGVGKTLVAAALVYGFAGKGFKAVGMKPVAAGAEEVAGVLRWEDVEVLKGASNLEAPPDLVNPYRFLPPVSPHLAARQAGTPIDLAHIRDAYLALAGWADRVVVEGVGGFLAPLNDRETAADLAVLLDLPVVLVVGVRLGCLSHALLTTEAVRARGLKLVGWVANRIDPSMALFDDNLATLQDRLSAPLIGVVPRLKRPDPAEAASHLDLTPLGE